MARRGRCRSRNVVTVNTAARVLVGLVFVALSIACADAADKRPKINPAEVGLPRNQPNPAVRSLYGATTPSGKRLSAEQLQPLIRFAPLPNSVGVVGYSNLKIGVFLLTVKPDGTVAKVEKLQSHGHPAVDIEVERSLKRWRFQPNSVDEARVPTVYGRQ